MKTESLFESSKEVEKERDRGDSRKNSLKFIIERVESDVKRIQKEKR